MNSCELESCLQQVASRGRCSAVYVLESREDTAAGKRPLWIVLPSKSPCTFLFPSLKYVQHVDALNEKVIKFFNAVLF